MRIDANLQPNTNTVDSVDKIGTGSIKGGELSCLFKMDAGITTMNSTMTNKNGLMEGLSGDGSLEAVKETAKVMKDNLTAMSTKMETGHVMKMDEKGLHVNDMEPDEIVTVVEQIQIQLATWCDDFSLTGTDVSKEDLQKVTGSSANANHILKAAQKNQYAPTPQEITDAAKALDLCTETKSYTDETKAYLLKNDLEPSIRNVYMASHSAAGMMATNPLTDAQWAQIRPQIEEMLNGTPLAKDLELLEHGRLLVEHEIDVTPQNLERLWELDSLLEPDAEFLADRIIATLIEGGQADDALITGETLPWEETMAAMQTLREATPEHVMAWVSHTAQRELTLDTLSEIEFLDRKEAVVDTNDAFIKAQRQLAEARLLMTLQAGRTLEKSGISINTLELSELVDRLKEYEMGAMTRPAEASGQGIGEPVTLAEMDQVTDTMLAYESLKSAPHVVLGVEDEKTVLSLNAAAEGIRVRFAGEAYEALQTEVRTDLGDSLKKAVRNSVDAIFSTLELEDNEANRRAVSVLAFHELEVNGENIGRIKKLDQSVNRLFRDLTPEKTLQMIREGIDPLHTDVNELADYLETKEAGTHDAERYSEYLYRLEQSGEISEEERAQYIGIYRMMYQLDADGMNALGGILQQGGTLNFENLLKAYMSGKDRGHSLEVSDEMETITVRDQLSYYRNLFRDLTGMVPSEEVAARELEEFKAAAEVSEETMQFVLEHHIAATPANLRSIGLLMKNPNQWLSNMENEDDAFAEWEGLSKNLPERDTIQSVVGTVAETLKQQEKEQVMDAETVQDVNVLQERVRGMQLMAQLVKRDNYYLPYEMEDGTKGLMNVRIVANSDTPGRFFVRMQNPKLGQATVEGNLQENTLYVQLMSDSREGSDELLNRVEAVRESLLQMGLSMQVQTSVTNAAPTLHSGVEEGIDVNKLLSVAKIFVEELAK